MNLKTISIVISTIILRIVISGLLKIMIKFFKCKKLKPYYKKICEGLYFESIIGLTLESYLEFLISAWLTIAQPISISFGDIISLFFSCVIAFLGLIFVPISFLWMIF